MDGLRRSTAWFLLGISLAGAMAPGCGRPAGDAAATTAVTPDKAGSFVFVNVAREVGLVRVSHAGRPGKDHLLDSAGTGVAWLDYDQDGLLDAYVLNGWALAGDQVQERGRYGLYRNTGQGTFEDVTAGAGVGGGGHWGSGVAVADYDRDGLPDLLVTTFGPTLLYRNRGDGRFDEVATAAGVDAAGWNTGAAFFDADGDGHLDLYVAGYVEQTLEAVLAARRTLNWKGMAHVAVGPFGMEGAPDFFYRSLGDGTFREATREAGLEDRGRAYGFAVRAGDFDRDGDADLYVANDSDPNYLYRNEGGGRFTEVGVLSGTALDANGAAQAGMGVAAGDSNGDGWPDLFVTHFAEDYSTLYLGEGRGFFRDATVATGLSESTFGPLSWGTVLADLDNDGDQDLVVANGHLYTQVDDHPQFGMSYRQTNQLLENDGHGRFRDVSAAAGPGFQEALSSRGLAAGDYDNDGDLDLLISHLDAPPSLLRNDGPVGRWLQVALQAPAGTPAIIGAVVEVVSGERRQFRDLASSSSFLSAHDPRLHFGLGQAATADRVTVTWPDGSRDVVHDVPCCQVLTLVRRGTPASAAARPMGGPETPSP